MDWVELVTVVGSVVTSVATLAYWLGRKFAAIDARFTAIDERFRAVEVRMGEGFRRLEARMSALVRWTDTLLEVLVVKGVLTQTEAMPLKAMARLIARPRSRYYTEEVYRRLMAILDKDWRDYTWDDVEELKRIVRLMLREAEETEDREYAEELIESAARVRLFAAALAGLLARRMDKTAAPE